MSSSRMDIGRFITDDVYYRLLQIFPACAPALGMCAQTASFICVRSWRNRLIENAALALGPLSSRAERVRCAYAMLGSMQLLIADVLASQNFSAAQLCARVTQLDRTSEYHAARALGRGVIITGIHMGAFEPALAILCQHERRVHVLFQPDPKPRFEHARQQMRQRLGVVEHHITNGVAAWGELLEALKADEAVVLHGDFVLPGQRGVCMPFLGDSKVHLPSGPVRLSAASGAPIIPTFCARAANGFRVWSDGFIRAPCEPVAVHEAAKHPAQLALVAAMERAIRAHPEQWMAFMNLKDFSGMRAQS